jgi:hypothetical protein
MGVREDALVDAQEKGVGEEDMELFVRWQSPKYSDSDGPVGINRALDRLYDMGKYNA